MYLPPGVPPILRGRVRGGAMSLQRRGGGAVLAHAEGARGTTTARATTCGRGRRGRRERCGDDTGGGYR